MEVTLQSAEKINLSCMFGIVKSQFTNKTNVAIKFLGDFSKLDFVNMVCFETYIITYTKIV